MEVFLIRLYTSNRNASTRQIRWLFVTGYTIAIVLFVWRYYKDRAEHYAYETIRQEAASMLSKCDDIDFVGYTVVYNNAVVDNDTAKKIAINIFRNAIYCSPAPYRRQNMMKSKFDSAQSDSSYVVIIDGPSAAEARIVWVVHLNGPVAIKYQNGSMRIGQCEPWTELRNLLY